MERGEWSRRQLHFPYTSGFKGQRQALCIALPVARHQGKMSSGEMLREISELEEQAEWQIFNYLYGIACLTVWVDSMRI